MIKVIEHLGEEYHTCRVETAVALEELVSALLSDQVTWKLTNWSGRHGYLRILATSSRHDAPLHSKHFESNDADEMRKLMAVAYFYAKATGSYRAILDEAFVTSPWLHRYAVHIARP